MEQKQVSSRAVGHLGEVGEKENSFPALLVLFHSRKHLPREVELLVFPPSHEKESVVSNQSDSLDGLGGKNPIN